jgi:hypothetical protein
LVRSLKAGVTLQAESPIPGPDLGPGLPGIGDRAPPRPASGSHERAW